MATYTGQISLSNGQTIFWADASSQAVNTACVADVNIPVVSGTHTQTDFTVASDCIITDITTDQTAGTKEIYNVTLGRRSGNLFQTTAKYATSVASRAVPRIGLRRGYTYRLIQVVAGAA